MFRWLCLFLGVYLVVGAISDLGRGDGAKRRMKLVAADARKLCFEKQASYVRLDAKLDPNDAVYYTGLASPEFSRCAPVSSFRLFDQEAKRAWSTLLGCEVESNRPLHTSALTLRVQALETDEEHDSRRQILSPVSQTHRMLWALSPKLARSQVDEQIDWSRSENIFGRLSRFDDLLVNQPTLEHSVAEIRRAYYDEFGQVVPEDAYIILPIAEGTLERLRSRQGACVLPIDGSDGALFAEVDREFLESYDGLLAGVLKPDRGHKHTSLARALGLPLPSRIGLIEPMSIESFEEQEASRVQSWLASGVFCSALGVWLILRNRRRFKSERAQVSSDIEEELERRRSLQESLEAIESDMPTDSHERETEVEQEPARAE